MEKQMSTEIQVNKTSCVQKIPKQVSLLPVAMSWTALEAKPTISTILVGGEILCRPPEIVDPS